MKRWLLAVLALSATALVAAPKSEQAVPQLIEVRKIWDAGEHNAFTDLIWWHNNWWCTFRESAGHVGGDGKIRVLISPDGGNGSPPPWWRKRTSICATRNFPSHPTTGS